MPHAHQEPWVRREPIHSEAQEKSTPTSIEVKDTSSKAERIAVHLASTVMQEEVNIPQ